jgi:hypothetical protein
MRLRTYTLTLQGTEEDIDNVVGKIEDMLECAGLVLVSEEPSPEEREIKVGDQVIEAATNLPATVFTVGKRHVTIKREDGSHQIFFIEGGNDPLIYEDTLVHILPTA